MDVSYPLLKIIAIGDAGVGKTSLIRTYCGLELELDEWDAPRSVDFYNKTLNINNTTIKLKLWDTGGQERFRCITPSFYRGVHICALVFDLTCTKSFDNACNIWYRQILECTHDKPNETILIGTKANLVDKREVTPDQINDFCHKHNLLYYEVIVTDYQSIEHIFDQSCLKMIKKLDLKESTKESIVEHKSRCC